ncbi:MAG: NADH:ubiquinone reductase (Na(+)-transporting) subunit F [Planctomycetota bacterium]|nr:NADH:ubiquinone reductase (Na(+)-transporting) subunit F [Planctomycetota bacterium]
MSEILVAVALFTTIVLVLVAIITAARKLLLPGGDLTISVNRDKKFVVRPGGKLLAALAGEGVFLPAACGGRGMCGLCRVRVLAGGGAILPTERAHIHRRDARRGDRLACQVPLKRDLVVELPRDVLAARQWRCRVRSNRNVATFIKEPVFELPAGEDVAFLAGGYIQVHVPQHDLRFADFRIEAAFRDEWERHGLLGLESHVGAEVTRAYSMANWPGEKGVIVLNVRIATPPPDAPRGTPPGRASSYLFGLRPGDEVTISGPYGEFFIHESDREMVYVGGGAGMAPLRSHIFELLKGRGSRRRISYWYGARSLCEIFYQDEFEKLAREHDNFEFHIALSAPSPGDEWDGPVGFIHQVLLDSYLKGHPAPEDAEYYLCGPPLMVDAVLRTLDGLGVERESIYYDDFGA